MEKVREVIRQQRLQKYVRILSDRYNLQLILDEFIPSNYACTDATKRIFIKSTIDDDPFMNLILHKGLSLHEIGHILFTSSKAWKDIDLNLASIIEDGRVEEAMSRKYPKARLYFVFINNKILHPRTIEKETGRKLIDFLLSDQLLQLIFRTAKKTTGIPPLPKDVDEHIRKTIGDHDYNWLVNQTTKAIQVKTEKQAAKIVKEIEKKLKEILGLYESDNLQETSIRQTSPTAKSSVKKAGTQSDDMPDLSKEDKQIIKKIIEEIIKQSEEQEEQQDSKEKLNDSDDSNSKNTDGESNGESDSDKDNDSDNNGKNDGDNTEADNDNEKKQSNDINIGEGAESFEGELDNDVEEEKTIMDEIEEEIDRETQTEILEESDLIKRNDIESDFSEYELYGDKSPFDGGGKGRSVINTNELEPLANRMAHLFRMIAQRGNDWDHNQTRGKLEMHRLPILLASTDQPRVFRRKHEIENTDLSAIILLDASQSMDGICEEATQAAYMITRSLEINDYNTEVVAFGVNHTYYHNDLYGLKSFNQKLMYARKRFRPAAIDGTPLLVALNGAEKSMKKVDSKQKVIFVVTDGAPHDPKECEKKVRQLEKQGISVVGILIKHTDQYNIFDERRRLICREIKELPIIMGEVVKGILLQIRR